MNKETIEVIVIFAKSLFTDLLILGAFALLIGMFLWFFKWVSVVVGIPAHILFISVVIAGAVLLSLGFTVRDGWRKAKRERRDEYRRLNPNNR